jgi:X-X-X-Leu-X-X-Gly heptad repeat protein
MMMRHSVIAVAVATIVAFGCGGSSAPPADHSAGSASGSAAGTAAGTASGTAGQPSQQSAQQMASGLQQLAQGMQQMQTGPDGKPIQVVDFEKLIALLPEVNGWAREKPHGEQSSTMFNVSSADARYTKGDFHVKVTLTDAALNPMLMTGFTMAMGMQNERSSTGFKRPGTYSGQPALEEWNSDSKNATVTIAVNKRFIVKAEGSDFDSFDVVKEVVNQIDLAKLAALK